MGLRSTLVVGIAAALTLVAASGVKGQLLDDRDRDYNDRFTAYIGSNTYQFSPSLNGELGRVKLYTILSHPDAAQDRDLGRAFWVVEIRSGDGSLVRRAIGKVDLDDVGQAYGEFTWNGRDGNGHLVSAGTYQYTFRSRFLPGRLLAAVSPDEYERVEVERAADEAYSSTGEVVVNYDLSVEDSLALRASRLKHSSFPMGQRYTSRFSSRQKSSRVNCVFARAAVFCGRTKKSIPSSLSARWASGKS